MAVQMAKRPVLQSHVDLMRRCARILCGEALLDMVIIDMHREFSSKLLEKLVGPVFHYIASSFVDAFIHRAEKVYTSI